MCSSKTILAQTLIAVCITILMEVTQSVLLTVILVNTLRISNVYLHAQRNTSWIWTDIHVCLSAKQCYIN